MKILFFIESLRSGGKERRFVELLHYLKQNTEYEIHVVLTDNVIHYNYVLDLGIPITIIKRKYFKKDPLLFFKFLNIIHKIKPDIIHTWGMLTTFYVLPAKILFKRPLIANLIAGARRNFNRFSLPNLYFKADCFFADIILSNSNAGFLAYDITSPKRKLIYNGVRMERFELEIEKHVIRERIGVSTPFMIIMVGSASKNKDYDFFLDVAKEFILIRNDVTFVGVGDGTELNRLQYRITNEQINNTILLGKSSQVESLISASDIGVLFSPSEGISNAIIEYMALGKPVITTDLIGGSREIVEDGKTGYIMKANTLEISSRISEIINNPDLMIKLGQRGKQIIEQKFSLESMGSEYVELYEKIFTNNK